MQYGYQGSIGNDGNELIEPDNVGIDTKIITLSCENMAEIVEKYFFLDGRHFRSCNLPECQHVFSCLVTINKDF